jgi:hypothetical protein
VQVQSQGGARQEEREQREAAERHSHPDNTATGRFPQAFLAT